MNKNAPEESCKVLEEEEVKLSSLSLLMIIFDSMADRDKARALRYGDVLLLFGGKFGSKF